ncbi:hypothetical protein [Streptomyces sp. NPDC056188]|uniref:hypothetical protein n=1 Tax=Streptomyces sp. NPDC056188 TaxID=3345740 RepID=UPI0035DE58A2
MPKLAAILATLAGLATQVIGVTILITTKATGDTGTVTSSTGLTLATTGVVLTLAGIPPACRAGYVWARDRGYILYREHERQDAEVDQRAVVHLARRETR